MNKTIIVCPYFETGGPESLHQLCHAINEFGGDAYIWYFGEKHDKPFPAYRQYNIKLTTELIDEEGYSIVLPECEGMKIHSITKAKLYFWWLSVDNNNFFQYGNSFNNPRVHHLYQSNYALHFLLSNNAVYYQKLFDYINDSFIEQSRSVGYDKENIVCYNPKKGAEYTAEIIKLLPNVNFIPLVNMSKDKVIETLRKSKVYIDFGYHPGKDKFPREAALMNNCVISGFRGSAMFYNDVPIDPLKYKFDVDDLQSAADRIVDCLENYNDRVKDFELYKNVVINQKEEAINDVKQIFHDETKL
jgi:hypothetical protein